MHFFLSIFTGNVMSHHKTIKDLENYYSKLSENQDYKKFLNNITSDKEGYGLLLMILDYSQVYLVSIHSTDFEFFRRILHLFPWSGIVNEDSQLSDTFRVPDPKTGQMRRLISQIPPKEGKNILLELLRIQ